MLQSELTNHNIVAEVFGLLVLRSFVHLLVAIRNYSFDLEYSFILFE